MRGPVLSLRSARSGATPSFDLQDLLQGFGSVQGLRAASPLPVDTQRVIDDAVVRVGRQRLVLVDDLIAEGLVYDLSDWLSTPTLYHERLGEAGSAQRAMVPDARGENQVMDRTGVTLPIFCTFDDFRFNIRELAAAARVGAPLDVSHTEQATRNVNEAIEDQAINGLGTGITIGGHSAPGLVSAPNKNTQAFVDTESWTHANHSGADILADVQNMVAKAHTAGRYGPYNLYVPTAYDLKLNQDYASGYPKSIRQRLEELAFGGRPLRVRALDRMPDDTVGLVQMTSDVVRVVMGQQPIPVSWTPGPGWKTFFSVLACVVVQFRDDYSSKSGVVIGTPSGS